MPKSSLFRARTLNCILDKRKNRKKLWAFPVTKQRFLRKFREAFFEISLKSKEDSQRKFAGKLQLCFIDFKAKYFVSKCLNFSLNKKLFERRDFTDKLNLFPI